MARTAIRTSSKTASERPTQSTPRTRTHAAAPPPGTRATPRPRRLGVAEGNASYKWWALSCTSLGMLLAATNSGTLIIALPDLERSLHASLLALVWVILAYLIAATVLVLLAGRLSDLFGRKRAY
ncbi:MAG TPA: MFS transporter, partial [Solirubrobacteraceae bacterium]|nr:MFS transporter [Solirubrobacteraceae bacterium]